MPKKKQAIHASGLVEVKATIGKNLEGKRIQKSFYGSSKLEAKRKADEYILQQQVANRTGEVFIKKDYAFEDWANKWLEIKKNTVKLSTYETTYKAKIDKYITPYFGKADLKDIKQIDIQNFFSKYSNLSKSTQNKFKIILASIFDSAIDNDLCYKNPVKNIKIQAVRVSEKRTYSLEQRDNLVKYFIDNNLFDMLILLKTGVRRSELLALKWDDFDLKLKTLSVNSAVTPSSQGAIESSTKTKSSDRLIPIDDELVNALKSNYASGLYVVGNREVFADPSAYAKRFAYKMEKIASSLEVPALSPHEFRHTFGTLLREQGADIYTIQKLMGHSDIGTTAKIYVHNDIEVLRKAMGI